MSIFNQTNDLAYLAVYGKHYEDTDSDPFRGRPDGVTEKDDVLHGTLREEGFELDLTGRPVSHGTWAEVAQEFQHYLACQIF
jgi:hypothetical protein